MGLTFRLLRGAKTLTILGMNWLILVSPEIEDICRALVGIRSTRGFPQILRSCHFVFVVFSSPPRLRRRPRLALLPAERPAPGETAVVRDCMFVFRGLFQIFARELLVAALHLRELARDLLDLHRLQEEGALRHGQRGAGLPGALEKDTEGVQYGKHPNRSESESGC